MTHVNLLKKTMQKTLFEELEEISKKPYQVASPLVLTRDDLVASDDGIIFPCVVARRLPVAERPVHMDGCDVCKRLEKELDERVGVVGHNVWYK